MRQIHYIFRSFYAFVPVLCLSFLLLQSTSFAGGFGDLFPRDIVDKIKSTDLKDIIRSSRESESVSEPASSKGNSTAAPAVAHKQQEIKPIENTTKQSGVVDPAVAKEAEEVKAWCYKKPTARINHDCECVASRFLEARQADPNGDKQGFLARITTGNQCPNLDGIKAEGYKGCMEGVHQMDTNGVEDEVYCQCVGKRFAKNIAEHKGKLGSGTRGNYRYYAIMHCRKPEAYR